MVAQAIFIINDPDLVKTLYPSDPNGAMPPLPTKDLRIISLPHPKFPSIEAKYMFVSGKVLEVQKVYHPEPEFNPRSWFIGESVDNNGEFYMCTPIDPLFLTLPHLVKACGGIGAESRFVELDTCFSEDTIGTEAAQPLLDYYMAMDASKREDILQRVCTKADTAGLICYRVCHDKLTQWLQKKVSRLAAAIANNSSLTPMGLKKESGKWEAADFGLKGWNADATYVLSLALEMLGDYVSKNIFDALLETYTDEKGEKFGEEHLLAVSKAKGGRVTADREIINEDNGKRKAGSQPAGKAKSAKAEPSNPKSGILRFFAKK